MMRAADTGRALRNTLLHIHGYDDGFSPCDVSGITIDSRRVTLYLPLWCSDYLTGASPQSFVAVLNTATDVLRQLVPVGRERPGIVVDAASGNVFAYALGSKALTLVCAAGTVAGC